MTGTDLARREPEAAARRRPVRRVLAALALAALAGCSLHTAPTVYEDGSFVLPDGRTGCVAHALCDDTGEVR